MAAAPHNITVEVTSDPPAWPEALAQWPQAHIFHRPEWGQVMRQVYGNRPFYLTARRGDRCVGCCQVIAQHSRLFGRHLASLPYFDAAGCLADDDDVRAALLAAAADLRDEQRAQWVELRHVEPFGDDLPTRTDKVTMLLDLPDDPDQLWQQFNPKVRNLVRKAEKADLLTVRGAADLLDEFVAIYTRNMRDLGSPGHSRRFFQGIIDAFGPAVTLFVTRSGDTPVAAAFTLADAHALRVPWAGSNYDFRGLNPNMHLYWDMLRHGCESGVPVFDFGRCTVDAGTHRFKKQWGARQVQLHWHFLLPPGGALPDLRPDSPKYRFMVAAWKKLPVPLAAALGPRLIAKLA